MDRGRRLWPVESLDMAKKKAKRRTVQTKERRKKGPGVEGPLSDYLLLRHVRLLDVEASLDIKEGRIPQEAQLQLNLSVGSASDDTIHVDGVLSVDAHPKDASEDEASRLTLRMRYQCEYDVSASLEEIEHRSEELVTPAMSVMWPYFRELLQSLVGRMGLPPFTLPPIAPSFVPSGGSKSSPRKAPSKK